MNEFNTIQCNNTDMANANAMQSNTDMSNSNAMQCNNTDTDIVKSDAMQCNTDLSHSNAAQCNNIDMANANAMQGNSAILNSNVMQDKHSSDVSMSQNIQLTPNYKSKKMNYHPLFFQNPGLPCNNTPLHLIAMQTRTLNELKAKLNEFDKEAIINMSLINNDKGQIPVDLITAPSPQAIKIKEYLYGIMQEGLQSTLRDPVNCKVDKLNIKLLYNLYIAEKVATQTRSIIHESSTHPQMNTYDRAKQDQIENKISKLRKYINSYQGPADKAECKAFYVNTYKVGNCDEFSYYSLNLLRKISPSLSGEILYTYNGDHVFLVIDRDKNSDLQNSSTWGPSAVVCDSWSGNVYSAEDIPVKLQSYNNYLLANNNFFNVTSSFNPRYHHNQVAYENKPNMPPLSDQQMLEVLLREKKISIGKTEDVSKASLLKLG